MLIFAYVGLNYIIYMLLAYLVGFVSIALTSREFMLFVMLNGVLLALAESIQTLMIGYFGVRELLGYRLVWGVIPFWGSC